MDSQTNDAVEETYGDTLKCPYCGHPRRDSEELGDGGEGGGETECGSCEREFRWSRTLTVRYYGKASNQND